MASVVESIDVKVPVSTAYNQWTQFESFPHFMEGVKSVTQTDDTHLHWVAEVGGAEKEWDAEITEQHADERVAWNAISGAENAGVVTFHRLDDTTTKVMLQLEWEPEGIVEPGPEYTALCDELGIDAISAGGTIAWAIETARSRGTVSRSIAGLASLFISAVVRSSSGDFLRVMQ